MTFQTKQELRERIKDLLDNQPEEVRVAKSEVIQQKLLSLPEFQKALTILFYASFNGEVHTFEMMKQAQTLGKSIALPEIIENRNEIRPILVKDLNEDLEKGRYGIHTPKYADDRCLSRDKIDMVIVPGVAFDKHNNRLGRGGGFYDRFLSHLPSETLSVGLAFDFQIVDDLPQKETHDMSVSLVLTN